MDNVVDEAELMNNSNALKNLELSDIAESPTKVEEFKEQERRDTKVGGQLKELMDQQDRILGKK